MSEVEGTDGRLLAGRYRLGALLGKGGMGTVWRAVDETLGRSVAVKELRFPGGVDDEEKRRLVTRTLREAKATARIRNAGAITVFDVVKEDDRPWIVMELVEGRSLSDAIREDGPLTPKRAAEIGLVLLDVLKAAHHEGILHRDVKPSNVLIADAGTSNGEAYAGGRVVLGDFGIAQIDGDPSVTSTGMLVGAPSYISPERARGQKPGPPADLWSLGALLYAVVEGHPPYDKGSAIATLTAVMTEPIAPMHNAGPLAEAITGLLVKDPAQRLTEPAARALLTAVAQAPDRPVAPPAPAADTSTIVFPVDPQPTPTDAPASTLEAVADQAQVRDALRSVRKSAAKLRSAPAPEPGTPANPPAPPARAPLSDVVPRRTLVIVLAAVVLAVLGTVIGVAIANSGGGKGGASKNGGAGTSPAVTRGASSATPSGASSTSAPAGGGTSPSSTPSSTPATGSGSDGNGGGGGGNGGGNGGSGGDSQLPSGYSVVADSSYHFRMAMPKGWHRTSVTSGGSGVIYSAQGGYPRVQIDYTNKPGKDAAATWRAHEPVQAPSISGYQRISIQSVTYRNYRTAADWDFYRTGNGQRVRVQNRGFVVDDTHAYSIMISIPADQWDSADATAMRNAFFSSFQPAG
jgi:serine/threonine protein kinase